MVLWQLQDQQINELIALPLYDMWHTLDLWDDLSILAPINNKKMVLNENPCLFKALGKYNLEPYPLKSRHILHKQAYGLQKAVVTRILGVQNLWARVFEPMVVANDVLNTCLVGGWRERVGCLVEENPRQLNYDKTVEWLAWHPKSIEKYQQLKNFLEVNLQLFDMKRINSHMKLESVMKNPIEFD